MAGVLEQLQQQIEELKVAISKLSDRVGGLELAGGLTRSPSAPDTKNICNEKPVRESGYVNWDESHDSIKNMKWISCFDLRRNVLYGTGINENNVANHINIDENTRFPKDLIPHVNISDPKLIYEVRFHMDLYSITEENRNKVLTLIENHMHTRYSFEEKYKLRWVDPKEQISINKEDEAKDKKEQQIFVANLSSSESSE